MSTKYQLKKLLDNQALDKLQEKAKRRSSFKPVKSWKLTCIEKVPAAIGRSISIEARDYIQALEHALYAAGFFLEKQTSETKI